MVYWRDGDSTIRTRCVSNGIPYSMDNEISPPYSESWRKGVLGQTFSEGYQGYARMRDRKLQERSCGGFFLSPLGLPKKHHPAPAHAVVAYHPRRFANSPLYRLLQDHWDLFLASSSAYPGHEGNAKTHW